MKPQKTDLVMVLFGLITGAFAFVGGCGVVSPCGDTKTVEEYPVESGTYVEDYFAGDGGGADVPLRYGHGDKTIELELESNTLRMTYLDNELREVVETWRIENLREIEGHD